MSNTKMYSLSFLPLESLNINTISEDLKYKEQFNLAVLIADNVAAVSKQVSLLNKSIKENNQTIEDLNKLIESYLYLLIITNTITSLDKQTETNHFKKFDLFQQKSLPNQEWANELVYTNQKSWFGPYGSILYELKDTIQIYRNPSQIVNFSFVKFIENLKVPEFYKTIVLESAQGEEESYDYIIYQQHLKLLEGFNIYTVLDILNKLEDWLIKAFQQEEYELLDCFIDNGLFGDNFTNLTYRFLHQDISAIELECLNSLILKSKLVLEEKPDIYLNLLDILPLSLPNNWFTLKSIELLEVLAPPGGFNYLIIQFAALLLNRAYYLTHQTITTSSTLTIANLNQLDSPEISRIARLLYYSGYLLQKSNLVHLRMYGNNISKFIKIEDINFKPKDILI